MRARVLNRSRHPHKASTKRYKTVYIPRKEATWREVTNELDKRGISWSVSYDESDDVYFINIERGTYIINGKVYYSARVYYMMRNMRTLRKNDPRYEFNPYDRITAIGIFGLRINNHMLSGNNVHDVFYYLNDKGTYTLADRNYYKIYGLN